MPRLNIERKILGNKDELFDFIANINDYSKFLPWCSYSAVTKKISETEVLADLTIKFGIFEHSYTSLVEIDRLNYIIKTRSTNGPFRYLESVWHLQNLTDNKNCVNVKFYIDFEIKIPFIKNILEKTVSNASLRILEAFEREFKNKVDS
jgi:coenzyme Q-binding protein COQ10